VQGKLIGDEGDARLLGPGCQSSSDHRGDCRNPCTYWESNSENRMDPTEINQEEKLTELVQVRNQYQPLVSGDSEPPGSVARELFT
jgi:hypothetical protein